MNIPAVLLAPMLFGIQWMDPNWLLDQFGSAFFWVSLAVIFVECGLFFPFLPGDTLLVAMGLFIAGEKISIIPGGPLVNLGFALVTLTAAAFAGNVVGYEIGRKIGPPLYEHDGKIIKQAYFDKTEAFFERHGKKALVIGRFIPFVRTYITIVAGASKMERHKFILWSLIGALAWVLSITLVGYFVGQSFPCILAARLRRVPAIVHEQNAAPGLANRVAVRLGARPAVSLPDTPLRGAVLTGNPVRAGLAAIVRAPDFDPPFVVFVGGSLGARSINNAALELFDRWRARDDVAIHHICGARDFERCDEGLTRLRRPSDVLSYTLVAYEEDMAGRYERAALFVARAGAVTCAELAATGTPSVLVPLPHAPADHQTRNAEALARVGAAVVVADGVLDGPRLDAELTTLLVETGRLDAMGRAAKMLAEPGAAAAVADLVEEAAGDA